MSIPIIPGLDPGLQIGGAGDRGDDPADPNAPPFFPNLQGGKILNLQGGKLLNHSGIGLDGGKLALKPPAWRMLPPYQEQWSQTETTIKATWNGPWSTNQAFRNWVLGYSTSILLPPVAAGAPPALPPGFGRIDNNPNPPGSPALLRTPPAQHPLYPWLYAVDCEIEGDGAWVPDPQAVLTDSAGVPVTRGVPPQTVPIEMIAFANNLGTGDFGGGVGRAVVTYQALDYEIRTDNDPLVAQFGELARWVSRYFEPSIQALPIAGEIKRQLQFLEGPYGPQPGKAALEIPEAGVKLFPTRSNRYKMWHWPDVPWAALAACTGKINATTFDGVPGHPSYAPGTLLCQAPTIERTPRTPAGRVSWTITLRLDERNVDGKGWNYFPAPDFGVYLAGLVDSLGKDTGKRVYDSADFSQLFAPPAPAQYQ